MKNYENLSLKRGRMLYILEAALEYFISILVAGSFLATLTKHLGMSDSLTGILSSIISLGCLFQLLSVFLQRRRVKKFVIGISITNQVLFLLLYIIPLCKGSSSLKISLAVVVIITAYAAYYFAHPKKINWLMSLVEDSKRGSFTANKEIISLISGMVFTFLMGVLVDSFAAKGKIETAFILTAFVMAIITVLHTLTMIFIPEQPIDNSVKKGIFSNISEVLKDKSIIYIIVLFALYNIANYITMPFYGTYLIGELGFSLKFVAIITMVSSISRVLFSKFLGSYADRNSFAKMLFMCFGFFGISLLGAGFANPRTGAVMFTVYYIFYGIAQGGINSALINLIFDYASPQKRSDSLAVCQAFSGVIGFFATLAASPLIEFIQHSGNSVFGITVYAQQFLSFIGFAVIAAAMIFIKKKLI